MGSYGIGVERLLACVAEVHHDERGLVWPLSVAPYDVYLILLRGKEAPEAGKIAEQLYTGLQKAGVETLFDDRVESPGIKFNDADLLGIPIRLTVSERGLSQGKIEMKLRSNSEKLMVPQDAIVDVVKETHAALLDEINAKVIPVMYNE